MTDIDLFRIASDAVELAKQYSISLHWPTLEEIGNVGVSVQRTPECPSCGPSGRVEELETVTTWHCSECDQSWEGGQN